jgi:hypothetical protein
MIKSFRNAHSEGRALILRLCIIYYERLVVRFIQDAPLLWSGAHRIINPKQDFYQCVCAIVDYLESLFKSRLTKMYILDEPDQIVWFLVTSVYNHHDVPVCERCERAIGTLDRDFPKSSNFLRLIEDFLITFYLWHYLHPSLCQMTATNRIYFCRRTLPLGYCIRVISSSWNPM